MKYQHSMVIALTGVLALFAALFAADDKGKVNIVSPVDKSKIKAGETFKVNYEIDKGKNGDHLHLVIDKNNAGVIRQLDGVLNAGPLKSGKHEICLTMNTKSHMPTGAEDCIDVIAE